MAHAKDAFDKQKAKDAEESPDTWDPDAGDTIWGVITRVKAVRFSNRTAPVINLKNTDSASGGIAKGKTGSIWLGSSLQRRFFDAVEGHPALGVEVGIRFDGSERSKGGNKFKAFTVVFPMNDDDEPDFPQDHDLWDPIEDAVARHQDGGGRGRGGGGRSRDDDDGSDWF